MTARTPQTIAAHIRMILAPATQAISHRLAQPDLSRSLVGCAVTLDGINLYDIASSLGEQRRQAQDGRPRTEGNGGGGSPATNSTTEDTATELDRLRMIGMDLQEAIDRLHPDPQWPSIASGWRSRTSTATEHLTAVIGDIAYGDGNYTDMLDAVDGVKVATGEVARLARLALHARAWRANRADTDPPVDAHEAARCSSWPLGKDRNGDPASCGQFRGMYGHRHPETGAAHHDDLCDSCLKLVCPQCWSRQRRTPEAKECMACEIRNRRTRSNAA